LIFATALPPDFLVFSSGHVTDVDDYSILLFVGIEERK
jgi:hypothetical protein